MHPKKKKKTKTNIFYATYQNEWAFIYLCHPKVNRNLGQRWKQPNRSKPITFKSLLGQVVSRTIFFFLIGKNNWIASYNGKTPTTSTNLKSQIFLCQQQILTTTVNFLKTFSPYQFSRVCMLKILRILSQKKKSLGRSH